MELGYLRNVKSEPAEVASNIMNPEPQRPAEVGANTVNQEFNRPAEMGNNIVSEVIDNERNIDTEAGVDLQHGVYTNHESHQVGRGNAEERYWNSGFVGVLPPLVAGGEIGGTHRKSRHHRGKRDFSAEG